MLKSNRNRACVFFAADYEPQIDFMVRLPGAAEACRQEFSGKHWNIGARGVLFQDTDARMLLMVDHRRVFLQALGLSAICEDVEGYSALVRIALSKMGVRKVKRLGMKIQAFLPIGMSHAEMVKLMFGSFFLPAGDLEGLCGKIDDCFVQIHGNRQGMKLELVVAPLTEEQAAQQFMNLPNLEHFVEKKLLDLGVKEFNDRISADCLLFDADLFRTDADPEDVQFFISNALQESEQLADGVVRKLKALPAAGDQ